MSVDRHVAQRGIRLRDGVAVTPPSRTMRALCPWFAALVWLGLAVGCGSSQSRHRDAGGDAGTSVDSGVDAGLAVDAGGPMFCCLGSDGGICPVVDGYPQLCFLGRCIIDPVAGSVPLPPNPCFVDGDCVTGVCVGGYTACGCGDDHCTNSPGRCAEPDAGP